MGEIKIKYYALLTNHDPVTLTLNKQSAQIAQIFYDSFSIDGVKANTCLVITITRESKPDDETNKKIKDMIKSFLLQSCPNLKSDMIVVIDGDVI